MMIIISMINDHLFHNVEIKFSDKVRDRPSFLKRKKKHKKLNEITHIECVMSPLFLIYSVGAWILCLCKAAYPISSLPPSTLFTVAHMLQHLHGLGHSHSINSMPENVSSSLSCLKTSRSQGKWDFNDAGVTNWAAITATGGLSSGDKQGIRI